MNISTPNIDYCFSIVANKRSAEQMNHESFVNTQNYTLQSFDSETMDKINNCAL